MSSHITPTDMHAARPIPGPLAAMERLAGVLISLRAARQPSAGRRAGPGRADSSARADVAL